MADKVGSKDGTKKAVVWCVVVFLSIIALLVGNTIVTKDFQLFSDSGGMNVRGKVVEIIDSHHRSNHLVELKLLQAIQLHLIAKLRVVSMQVKLLQRNRH